MATPTTMMIPVPPIETEDGRFVTIGRMYGSSAINTRKIAPSTVIRFSTLDKYSLVSVPGRMPGI